MARLRFLRFRRAIEQAEILNQQATKLFKEGRYAEAISIAEKVLAITEKALGPEHPFVAQTLNNLAALYKALGDYAKAEALFKRAQAIKQKSN
jgi:tetratricopeptide (TPR) repeat protein